MPVLCALWLAVFAHAGELLPPAPPQRPKGELDTAAALALDLSRTLAFLEQGKAYFAAFSRGTHTPAENKALVRFLEDYDRELATAKKELELLRAWLEKNAELKR